MRKPRSLYLNRNRDGSLFGYRKGGMRVVEVEHNGIFSVESVRHDNPKDARKLARWLNAWADWKEGKSE